MIVDAAEVAPFVAERFGWGTRASMVPAADGAMGRIWRLDTSKAAYAVKELYWARDAEAEEIAIAQQVEFCELARAAGVLAPASLKSTSGQFLVALPAQLEGRLIRAYEWVDGRAITSSVEGAAAWAGQTHALIEGLAVRAEADDFDPWSLVPPSADAWDVVAKRCEQAGLTWADDLRVTLDRFIAWADIMKPADDPSLIVFHTDFQPQNVLITADGNFVLLDWDDAGPSSRSRALGSLLNNWHLHDSRFDLDGIQQTMGAYRAAGGTAKITGISDFGDSICGYLNYVHGQANLSLDHTQPSNLRSDADQRMHTLLNPPAPSVYEEAALVAADL